MAKYRFAYLKNYLKNKLYPYTHSDGVFTDENETTTLTETLNEINSKINNTTGLQSDWNESDISSGSYIKNKPSSLPANGGNADTLDGKSSDEFVANNDYNQHLIDITAHQSQFNKKADKEEVNSLISDIQNAQNHINDNAKHLPEGATNGKILGVVSDNYAWVDMPTESGSSITVSLVPYSSYLIKIYSEIGGEVDFPFICKPGKINSIELCHTNKIYVDNILHCWVTIIGDLLITHNTVVTERTYDGILYYSKRFFITNIGSSDRTLSPELLRIKIIT